MSELHLVTGGDEDRRSALLVELTARLTRDGVAPVVLGSSGARSVDPDASTSPATRLLACLRTAADGVLAALGLPVDVRADLTAGLRSGALEAVLDAAALLDASERVVVLVCPPGHDPADLVSLPARAAQAARSLQPVLARWEVLLGPPGIGVLDRPEPAALDALRDVEECLTRLDEVLATRAELHHVPGRGVLEEDRTVDLSTALALMGRRLGAVHDGPMRGATPRPVPPAGDGTGTTGEGSPFALALPLPGLRAGDIVLEREEDDVVVTVGRHRRVTRLGPLHRRCVITGAAMRAGVLTLDLEPDEAVWPGAPR